MNTAPLDPLSLTLLASLGQAAFIGVYLLLLAGIIWMPKRLSGTTSDRAPWWKNLRLWSAVICGVQILVYGLLG